MEKYYQSLADILIEAAKLYKVASPKDLRNLRKRRNITQEELAEIMNISQATICLIEQKEKFYLDDALLIKKYLAAIDYINETECEIMEDL